MSLKVGIVRFPGANCDYDAWKAVEHGKGQAHWLWQTDYFDPSAYDAILVPGGFSFGDYLRAGALAARSAVMKSVKEASLKGVPVLGICNGFQILCEAGLLPGALVKNEGLRFLDQWSSLTLKNKNKFWAADYLEGTEISLPIAHGEGRFYLEEDEVKKLYDSNQVWWTYRKNPNGSVSDIAGVSNKEGNVCALMPHPERAMAPWMGGDLGAKFFASFAGGSL